MTERHHQLGIVAIVAFAAMLACAIGNMIPAEKMPVTLAGKMYVLQQAFSALVLIGLCIFSLSMWAGDWGTRPRSRMVYVCTIFAMFFAAESGGQTPDLRINAAGFVVSAIGALIFLQIGGVEPAEQLETAPVPEETPSQTEEN